MDMKNMVHGVEEARERFSASTEEPVSLSKADAYLIGIVVYSLRNNFPVTRKSDVIYLDELIPFGISKLSEIPFLPEKDREVLVAETLVPLAREVVPPKFILGFYEHTPMIFESYLQCKTDECIISDDSLDKALLSVATLYEDKAAEPCSKCGWSLRDVFLQATIGQEDYLRFVCTHGDKFIPNNVVPALGCVVASHSIEKEVRNVINMSNPEIAIPLDFKENEEYHNNLIEDSKRMKEAYKNRAIEECGEEVYNSLVTLMRNIDMKKSRRWNVDKDINDALKGLSDLLGL